MYSWNGKELVLLPVDTEEYRTSTAFTNLQDKKVGKKEMAIGCTYIDKSNKHLIYLGRYIYREPNWRGDWESSIKHIFYDINDNKYVPHKGFTKLAIRETETCIDNYAELLDEYLSSKYSAKPIKFIGKKAILSPGVDEDLDLGYPHIRDYGNNLTDLYQLINGKYYKVEITPKIDWDENSRNHIIKGFYIVKKQYITLDDGNLKRTDGDRYSWRYDKHIHGELLSYKEIETLDFQNIFLILDSGSEIIIGDYQ